MKHGYVIIAKDYKAEICEFETLTVINMPDGTKLYFVHTKYGDNYFSEGDLRPARSDLEKECREMNEALVIAREQNARSSYKVYKG